MYCIEGSANNDELRLQVLVDGWARILKQLHEGGVGSILVRGWLQDQCDKAVKLLACVRCFSKW
jgi:hypothetical protein